MDTLAENLDAEFGTIGFGRHGWLVQGNGGVPAFHDAASAAAPPAAPPAAPADPAAARRVLAALRPQLEALIGACLPGVGWADLCGMLEKARPPARRTLTLALTLTLTLTLALTRRGATSSE